MKPDLISSAPSRNVQVGANSRRVEVQVPARAAAIDQAIFWLLIAAVAWLPFWYGSNDLVAWGINAVIFPGLAVVYELSLLIRGERHPVGIRNLALPAALFTGVVIWTWLQTVSWVPVKIIHPIWGMAANALDRPVMGSISVNRDLTMLGLIGLATAASAFWLAVQLCRNATRANLLLQSVAAIVSIYAAYGLLAFALKAGRVPWFETPTTAGSVVSSTFINRNSFATYAGIGMVVICGLILQLYRREVEGLDGPHQLRIAALIETTGQRGVILIGGASLILVALLLTGSRGGIIATGLGLFVLGALTFRHGKKRSLKLLETLAFTGGLVAAAFLAFGDVFVGSISERGVGDAGRMAIYLIMLRSILDSPLSGYGYGAFTDIFPMYRDGSIGAHGVWEQAHNSYLETFQGLGLVFGSMLIACVLLLVLRCVRGAATRQKNITIPCVAASVAFLVGIHALVDFSLQIQAIALTFVVILGAGVAQSESSRLALGD